MPDKAPILGAMPDNTGGLRPRYWLQRRDVHPIINDGAAWTYRAYPKPGWNNLRPLEDGRVINSRPQPFAGTR